MTEEVVECSHWWVLEEASGPMSTGIYFTCGETKTFQNYIEAKPWGTQYPEEPEA